MGLFKRCGADYFQGRPVYCQGVIPAHKTKVRRYNGMSARQTVAVGGNFDYGIDEDGPVFDDLPEGRRRFHEFFLEGSAVVAPEDAQRYFGTQRDTLGAAYAKFPIISRIATYRELGGAGGAGRNAIAATAAHSRNKLGIDIGVHALLLRPRGKPHGDILQGAAKTGNHVTLEVRKDHKSIGLFDLSRHLHRRKMFITRRYLDHIAPVQAVRDDNRTTKKLFVVTMLRRRREGIFSRAATLFLVISGSSFIPKCA